jgi:hypothetical protein
MFRRKATEVEQDLDKVIDALLKQMADDDPKTQEYAKMADQLSKLMTLKKEQDSGRHVSPDTWAIIGANLAGILIIVAYEQAGRIITTKAMSILKRP